MNCLSFKHNFAVNNINYYEAKSFLRSDLFLASLIACDKYRIISGRDLDEGNNKDGPEFIKEVINLVDREERITEKLKEKLMFMIFCGNIPEAKSSLKK